MKNTGWALVDAQGGVFMNTVASTKKAAMVNALVSNFQEPIFQQDTDIKIRSLFEKHTEGHGLKIKSVSVQVHNLI